MIQHIFFLQIFFSLNKQKKSLLHFLFFTSQISKNVLTVHINNRKLRVCNNFVMILKSSQYIIMRTKQVWGHFKIGYTMSEHISTLESSPHIVWISTPQL